MNKLAAGLAALILVAPRAPVSLFGAVGAGF
jgi:hypothetical protein